MDDVSEVQSYEMVKNKSAINKETLTNIVEEEENLCRFQTRKYWVWL